MKTRKHQACLISSAGTCATSGRRPSLYCIPARPFAAAGHDPGPHAGRLHISGMGVGGGWWACWPDTFLFGSWSLTLQPPPFPFSPSRPSRTFVRVGPPATVLGPTRPAGHAVAGCRPSYPSRIRVTRAATLRRRRPGGPLPRRRPGGPLPRRRGAGIRLRGRPEPTSPSITEERAGVIKTWVTVRDESTYRQF